MIGNNTEAFSIPASTNVKKFAIPFASPDNTPYRFPFILLSSFGEIFLNAEIEKTTEQRSIANNMNSLLYDSG